MTAFVEALKHIRLPRIDGAWTTIVLVLAGLAVLAPEQLPASLVSTLRALAHTAPFILFAVLAVAYLKATGAEAIVARAFEGRQVRMICLAALIGGLSPFCSCEVIPFVAGLLALGTPIAPVMAFWLASPLMDPSAFLITASALGFQFAIAKVFVAVGMGLMGGFALFAATRAGWFTEPLRPRAAGGGCCGCGTSFHGAPVWRFWSEAERRDVFYREAVANAQFLFKWLALAYLLESLMLAYLPAGTIARVLGGDGLMPIVLSALIGVPAYLNAYAAPPLVAGLMAQGMSPGAAMAFVVAGGVSCIPAMTAVFALVRRPIFAAYVVLGFTGAVVAGVVYGLLAAT